MIILENEINYKLFQTSIIICSLVGQITSIFLNKLKYDYMSYNQIKITEIIYVNIK